MTHLLDNAVDVLCWVLVLPALAYLGFRSYEKAEDRRGLLIKWIVSVPLLILLIHVSAAL